MGEERSKEGARRARSALTPPHSPRHTVPHALQNGEGTVAGAQGGGGPAARCAPHLHSARELEQRTDGVLDVVLPRGIGGHPPHGLQWAQQEFREVQLMSPEVHEQAPARSAAVHSPP